MRLHHLVTYEDGSTVEVKTAPADVLAWERENGKAMHTVEDADSSAWMFWLVWHNLKRRHGETRDFEAWLDEVAETRSLVSDDADPPAETEPAPPDS